MIKHLATATLALAVSTTAFGQAVTFQNGVSALPGGGLYGGTTDIELRAADPTNSQEGLPTITIDDFDAGFQTQGLIRFNNLLISEGGLVPDQVATGQFELVFAELRLWVTSNTDANAIINFNRIVGPDTTAGRFWNSSDTWASLGGDLIPDEGGFLMGDPVLENGVEAASTPDFVVPTQTPTPTDADTTATSNGLATLLINSGSAPADALENAFFRFNATDAVRSWIIDDAPNFGWSINNNTGNGWDFRAADFFTATGVDPTTAPNGVVSLGGVDFPAEVFRPALTVVFASPGGRGDLDFDGDVDLVDYQLLLDNLAVELDGPIATGATGDLDFNRAVDLNDFAIFKNEFEIANGSGSFARALAAPEPTTALLAALCGVAATFRRR